LLSAMARMKSVYGEILAAVDFQLSLILTKYGKPMTFVLKAVDWKFAKSSDMYYLSDW
jgi:hypothetical protein